MTRRSEREGTFPGVGSSGGRSDILVGPDDEGIPVSVSFEELDDSVARDMRATMPVRNASAETMSPPQAHTEILAKFPPSAGQRSAVPISTAKAPVAEVSAEVPTSSKRERKPETPALALTDETCGRYQLCFELAAGGMANLFLARQGGPFGFDKLVALKRIHSHLHSEKDFVEMFLDEARVAANITHPNVCSVIDFGEASGTYFLAMDYLFGEPLSNIRTLLFEDYDLLSRSLAVTLRIVADAAEGLHAAHELRDSEGALLNVVHRDVCPQNLFVTYDGNTKVVDFGIAKARGRLHRTATGVLKGHLAYMAPEQFATNDVDRRIDVWALGVVLWELCTGVRLFPQTTSVAKAVAAIMTGQIRPPSAVRPELPPELDAIVLRALTRAPEDRYPTTRELGRDLQRFLHHHCEPIGLAEMSEWMGAAFEQEREAKLLLVRLARNAQ